MANSSFQNLMAAEISQNTKDATIPLHHSQLPSQQQQLQQQTQLQPQQPLLKFSHLPQLPQLPHQTHSNYPYHTLSQLNPSRITIPPQLIVDPSLARDGIFMSQAGCSTLVPMSESILWPGTTDNSNYLNNISSTSQIGDMLYYDSQNEALQAPKQSRNYTHQNDFKYMNENSFF
ncbi:hypothetical protein EV44_g3377 [Erysiphe necator]|uniref:Uncharacterized protein n=1 Tax=Uncinula necator TaxID=52586 RepID=A0A0B1P9X2_UNCNE|nr:hypothetical protein EV44_g3377 [Erysiphe necator]